MRLFPRVQELCLSINIAVTTFDFSEAILGVARSRDGEKPMTEFVREMLETHEGEPEFLRSNIINGYVALHNQIKLLMDLVDTLDQEISKLDS